MAMRLRAIMSENKGWLWVPRKGLDWLPLYQIGVEGVRLLPCWVDQASIAIGAESSQDNEHVINTDVAIEVHVLRPAKAVASDVGEQAQNVVHIDVAIDFDIPVTQGWLISVEQPVAVVVNAMLCSRRIRVHRGKQSPPIDEFPSGISHA